MGFPTLVFYLYLIVAPVGLVLFGLWLARYMSRLAYPPEKRILFIVIVIACLAFILFSMGSSLNKWRLPGANNTPNQQSQQNTAQQTATATTTLPRETRVPDNPVANTSTFVIGTSEKNVTAKSTQLNYEELLEQYEKDNHPELYKQRMELIEKINTQKNFIERLRQLAVRVPKQEQFLLDIYRIRKTAYDRLQQHNVYVSQELRDFWVHYNTGNVQHAIKKFNGVSTQLTKSIKVILGQLLDSEREEERVIRKYMRQAGLALKNNKIPTHQAGKITTYSFQNRALIIDWLSRNNHTYMLEALEQLRQKRATILDRYKGVLSFQKRYPDLKTRLNRTLKLWAKAQESNYYAEYRLLYAAEIRFIIDHMAMAHGTEADQNLSRELSTYIKSVSDHAEKAFEKAEQAYKPGQLR